MPIPGFFYSSIRGPRWLNPHINPDPRNRINLLHVVPDTGARFRGGGGYGGGFSLWFNDERYTMSAVMWFWLPETHINEGIYTIQPVANLTGELRAFTRGRSMFEEPVLTLDMDLWQEIQLGDQIIRKTPASYQLVNQHRRSNRNIYKTYRGDRFLFPSHELIVIEPAPLVITLHVEMRFWRDSSGNFWFYPYGADEFFRIDIPRWRLGYRLDSSIM